MYRIPSQHNSWIHVQSCNQYKVSELDEDIKLILVFSFYVLTDINTHSAHAVDYVGLIDSCLHPR